ncbi:alkaline phosphatase [Luminiphilus syltensis]|nr:alkaline phosphatase [Luminiphilus syltensis]
MKYRPFFMLLTALLASLVQAESSNSEEPRAVILLIGDGLGPQQLTMARNYLTGSAGQLLVDTAPVYASIQIETEAADGTPLYVPDSANTGTAMASGVVTNINHVGVRPDGTPVTSIIEAASRAGYRTGIITTAAVTDATPATFLAHISHDDCENPAVILGGTVYGRHFPGCPEEATENGGPGSTAEQIAKSPVDLLLGGGRVHFLPTIAGSNQRVRDAASENGFLVVDRLGQLDALTPGQRALGLLAKENLKVRMRGSGSRKAEPVTLTDPSNPNAPVILPPPMSCEPNPEFGDTPTLRQMTATALRLLSAENPKGFFLMVESASIDKQSHQRNPCGAIGEVQQLEEALAEALKFTESHPRTLILVTADHSHGVQIVPEPSAYGGGAAEGVHSPGKIARLKTPEGGLMRLNYGVNNYAVTEHTGANVALFGNAEAKGLVTPYMRQREIHTVMMRYLSLAPQPTSSNTHE